MDINKNGTTTPSVDYRLSKADTAVNVHSDVLFAQGGSHLRERFREYVKRIVPVVLHPCNSWALDVDL